VPKGNPKSVLTFDDVKSKALKLAVLSGAVEQGYAQKSGVPDGQVQAFDTQTRCCRRWPPGGRMPAR